VVTFMILVGRVAWHAMLPERTRIDRIGYDDPPA